MDNATEPSHYSQTTTDESGTTEAAPLPPELVMDWFNPFSLTISSIGFLANFIFFIFVMRHTVGSRLSTHLLRAQSFEDMVIMLLTIVERLQPANYFLLTPYREFNEFICRMWYTQSFYWTIVGLSVWNLVWVSLDRFILVLFPFAYRRLPRTKVLSLLICLEVLISGSQIPFQYTIIGKYSDADGGRCQVGGEAYGDQPRIMALQRDFSIFWETVYWIVPSVAIVFLNFSVLIGLKCMTMKAASSTASRDDLVVRFTVATVIISFLFVICFALDGYLLLYATIQSDMASYYYANPLQKVGLFIVGLNFISNPFIFALLLRDFRTFLKFWQCRAVKGAQQTSTSFTAPSGGQ